MKIRVVRESGGIGDIIRLFPVFDGLRAKYPDALIDFYSLGEYKDFVRDHCPSVDRFIVCPRDKRRPRDAPLDETKHPYLRKSVVYDLSLDMYCPAWAHERDTRGSVSVDRVELFCRAAGVEPGPVVYRLSEAERETGRAWAASLGVDPSRVIAVQPFATHIARCWSRDHWIETLDRLLALDFAPVVFDGCRGRVRAIGDQRALPGFHEVENSLTDLAAKLAACNWLLGVDSGLLHVAGAVGTPTLCVFGCTSGPLVCKPYPRAQWITAPKPDDAPAGCCAPCYAFRERGYAQACRDGGCAVARAVTPDALIERFLELWTDMEDATCAESQSCSSARC